MNEYNIVSSIPSCVWTNGVAINDRIDSMYYRSSSIKDYQKIKKFSKIRRVSNYFDVSKLSGFEYTDYFTEESLKSGTVIALTSQNVMENQINFDNIIKIPFEIHNSLERSKIYPNDILLSYTGQYRRACTAPQNIELHLGPNICRLRSTKLIDVHYVSTFLNCRYGQSSLDREKTMSAQPTVNMSRIRDILLPIPSSEIQKYIGDKVRKAEELREEAKRLKKEAEEILNDELEFKTLEEKLNKCKEKFLWIKPKDFDNRMDGEFYKIDFIINNEHIDTLKNKGVQVLDLKDIINKGSYGILPSSDDYGKGEVVLLRSTNIKEFLIDNSEVIKVPNVYYKEKVQVNQGDILLEIKGQCYSGAIATELKEKTIVNGSIYKFSVKKGYDNHYVLAYLLSKSGQLQKQQNLANSIISYLSLECINNLKVPIISSGKQKLIGEKYRTYVEQINKSKQLIQEAKNDVGDLIEGNFSMKE